MPTENQNIAALIANLRARDREIGAFTRFFPDAEIWTQGSGLLAGLTVAMKDNMSVPPHALTAGIAGWKDRGSQGDSMPYAHAKQAGALVVGTTNMDEAAFGATSDNPTFGRTQNPLKPGYTPGGSSGGAAAAVAAGMVDIGIGSDTLGSVRLPASYCGIFGLKPTFGTIGRQGMALLAPSLDTVGVLVRDPALLFRAYRALRGSDGRDQDWRMRPGGFDEEITDEAAAGPLWIDIPREISKVECEEPVMQALDMAREALRGLGATGMRSEMDDIWWPEGLRRAGVLVIEAEGAVELAELMDQEGAISPGLHKALAYGRDAPSGKIVQAYAMMRRLRNILKEHFTNRLILLPTAPQRAFKHGTPPPANQAVFTALANAAGMPAVSIPVWLPGEELPAGVQLVGPEFSEARLCYWAQRLAEALPARPG